MTQLSRTEMAKISAQRTHDVVGAMHGQQNRGCMAASFMVFLMLMTCAAMIAHSKRETVEKRTTLSIHK
jgi:Fe2+ transport system protein B